VSVRVSIDKKSQSERESVVINQIFLSRK